MVKRTYLQATESDSLSPMTLSPLLTIIQFLYILRQ